MKKAKGIISTHKIILQGILLGVVFWFIDSVVDVIFFTDHTFIEHLINPKPLEIWMWSVAFILFILFSVYVSRIINKLKRAEEALKGLNEELEMYRFALDRASYGAATAA